MTLSLLYLAALLLALWHIPWRVLIQQNALQHAIYAATVGLTMLWCLRAEVSPGLTVHFLGAGLVTLIFGWDLAILVLSIALLATMTLGFIDWAAFGINSLALIVAPVAFSYGFLKGIEAIFPRNFFIYLFLGGFLNSGLATMISALVTAAVLGFAGVYDWPKLYLDYIRWLPLIIFPEGLISGILLTGLMVYLPDWIRTFDSKAYIDDQ